MKILKKILIGLGALFVGFICLAIFISYGSTSFLDENKKFIEEFSYDLTESWSTSDVHSRLSNEFLKLMDTPNGEFAFNQLRQLGSLKETSDYEIGRYTSGTAGKTAVITFKATFDNAKGLVTITLLEKDNKVLVQGFHVSAPDGFFSATASKHEA